MILLDVVRHYINVISLSIHLSTDLHPPIYLLTYIYTSIYSYLFIHLLITIYLSIYLYKSHPPLPPPSFILLKHRLHKFLQASTSSSSSTVHARRSVARDEKGELAAD